MLPTWCRSRFYFLGVALERSGGMPEQLQLGALDEACAEMLGSLGRRGLFREQSRRDVGLACRLWSQRRLAKTFRTGKTRTVCPMLEM